MLPLLRLATSSLFADGSDRHPHAVATNLDWAGDRLINWHRENASTVEHIHHEVKNALTGCLWPKPPSARPTC
jgi:hypothetical protein